LTSLLIARFFYDFNDVKVFKAAEDELRRQVEAVVDGKFIPDSPIKGSLLSLERRDSAPDILNEVLTVLRNHSEILNELNYKIEKLSRVSTVTTRPEIPVLIPTFVSAALALLERQGYQIIVREIDEVTEIKDYQRLLTSNWNFFMRELQNNYDAGYPYINFSKEKNYLWFWNRENKTIYLWEGFKSKRVERSP